MTLDELRISGWSKLAQECLAKHNPDTMAEFWMLLGFAVVRIDTDGAHDTAHTLVELGRAFNDTAVVDLLSRAVAAGRLKNI